MDNPLPVHAPRHSHDPSILAHDDLHAADDHGQHSPPAFDAFDRDTAAMRARLSSDQVEVLRLAQQQRSSIFLHGGPGTGKSAVIEQLRARAAVLLDRVRSVRLRCSSPSLWSHAALGARRGHQQNVQRRAWAKVSSNVWTRRALATMRGLIIDEISMCDARLMIVCDLLLRVVNERIDVPFGGVQVILAGDFLQLPPVWRDTPEDRPWVNCFSFHAFRFMGFEPLRCDLTKIFRQQDPAFLTLLREARLGFITPRGRRLLETCRERKLPPGVNPTMLMSRNSDVDACNLARLAKHPVRVKLVPLACKRVKAVRLPFSGRRALRIEAWSSRNAEVKALQRFLKLQNFGNSLVLCIRACVLLRANACVQEGFANGSTGMVVGFMHRQNVYGDTKYPSFCLLPVASLKDKRILRTDAEVKAAGPKAKLLPVVWFQAQKRLVVVGEFRFMYQSSVVYMVPLKLAWAMTVDRAQGATMTCVRMSLRFGRRAGVGNVAISRVTTLEGLQLTDERIPANPFVANQVALKHFGKPPPPAAFGKVYDWPLLGFGTAIAREWRTSFEKAKNIIKMGKGGEGKQRGWNGRR